MNRLFSPRLCTARPVVAVWYASSGAPQRLKDPPTSLFSTISDPSLCMCVQDKVCVGLEGAVTVENRRAVGGTNLVCQLHRTSPSIPVNAPRGHSSISIIHNCDHDLRACQKESPWVTYYLWRCPAPFSLRLHSIPAVKVQDAVKWCIYQSHSGNLHSGGTQAGVLVQRPEMEEA